MKYIPAHGFHGHFLISNKSVITCKINSCAKSAWYARRQHWYNICKDFLSHNSWMKNLNFTNSFWEICKDYIKTINSNNSTKLEVNWPRGSQFTARYVSPAVKLCELVMKWQFLINIHRWWWCLPELGNLSTMFW